MGFFSWKTSDTNESIPNKHSIRDTFPVYLLQPHGLPTLKEDDYDGYGIFVGRDVYALVAEWNGQKVTGNDREDRLIGIDISFERNADGSTELEFPIKLVRDPNLSYDDAEASEDCPDQGFFYEDNEDEHSCPCCGAYV